MHTGGSFVATCRIIHGYNSNKSTKKVPTKHKPQCLLVLFHINLSNHSWVITATQVQWKSCQNTNLSVGWSCLTLTCFCRGTAGDQNPRGWQESRVWSLTLSQPREWFCMKMSSDVTLSAVLQTMAGKDKGIQKYNILIKCHPSCKAACQNAELNFSETVFLQNILTEWSSRVICVFWSFVLPSPNELTSAPSTYIPVPQEMDSPLYAKGHKTVSTLPASVGPSYRHCGMSSQWKVIQCEDVDS